MKKLFTLMPFIIFIATFITLNIFFSGIDAHIKTDFPIYAAFLAIIASFFTFKTKTTLNEKIEVFIQGAAQTTVIHLCFIFLFSTLFTYTLTQIGGTQTAVDVALYFLPQNLILPGIFLVTAAFSICVGTSMGTIITFMPIFYKVAQTLSINPSLTAGIVVSGAMLGDNISLISDTTIAATKVTGSTIIAKFKDNFRIALPAATGTLIILSYINLTQITVQQIMTLPEFANINFFNVIPYFATFFLALAGFDILCVLIFGMAIAMIIGLYFGRIELFNIMTFFHHGFYQSKSMITIFILVLFLSGLSKIIAHNGGIDYLLELLGKESKSATRTKFEIFTLVFLVNCAIAINTISIIITGPIAAKLGKDKLKQGRIANLLDIGACVSQGILPYTPQILLAASLSNISPLSTTPYLYYPYALLIATIVDMAIRKD